MTAIKKKLHIANFKLWVLTVTVFVLSVPLLIFLPNIGDLLQSHILVSANSLPGLNNSLPALPQKPQIKIESLGVNPPLLSARSVIAEDFDSGDILYQKDIHKRMLPASTTKIMTALIAVNYYKPSDVLTVPSEAMVGGSTMGLYPGEKISFRSLLYGMLLNSGNDAAFTLAIDYPGGKDGFMAQMNLKAQTMGLTDTHFENPAGFDGLTQYSSAYDLARISIAAASNPELSKVVSTKETEVESTDGSGKEHVLKNLNQLLDIEGVIGFKTGTTPEAGQNFVGLVERNNHKVLTVVLDSVDRYADTKQLMDWTYQNFAWYQSP